MLPRSVAPHPATRDFRPVYVLFLRESNGRHIGLTYAKCNKEILYNYKYFMTIRSLILF